MVKKTAIVRTMPNGMPYIIKEKSYGTTFKQYKSSGLMSGRKAVQGQGDKTGVKRVKKDFVLVKGTSGKRGYVRKKYEAGEILGRY